jgi:hypothetical protein
VMRDGDGDGDGDVEGRKGRSGRDFTAKNG